jgi:hypothetical protein
MDRDADLPQLAVYRRELCVNDDLRLREQLVVPREGL